MSKKNKKNKAKLAQALQELSSQKIEKKSIVKTQKLENQTISKSNDQEIVDDKEVKKDIGKIIVALSICVIILISFWLISIKTSYLNNSINAVISFLHIA